MPDLKDQMIEEAQEQREELENVLDDIESCGESYGWFVISHNIERSA
jgi:hypothetical protein